MFMNSIDEIYDEFLIDFLFGMVKLLSVSFGTSVSNLL